MNYKYQLFEKAIKTEHEFETQPTGKNRKRMEAFLDELWLNGWRQEYDIWSQNIKE